MTEPYPIEELAEAARESVLRDLPNARALGNGLFKFTIYHPDGRRNIDVTGYLLPEDFTSGQIDWTLAPALEVFTERAKKWAAEDQARDAQAAAEAWVLKQRADSGFRSPDPIEADVNE
jgi:hypothetical protein